MADEVAIIRKPSKAPIATIELGPELKVRPWAQNIIGEYRAVGFTRGSDEYCHACIGAAELEHLIEGLQELRDGMVR